MPSFTTNYTTYDLAAYYADLKELARLTDEQRQGLRTALLVASTPEEATALKHQLIQSYLSFATRLALDLCPASRYQRWFPDLLAAANLILVETVMERDLHTIQCLTPYLAACMRAAMKRAMQGERFIKISASVRARAQQQGRPDAFSALEHVLSLEEQMESARPDEQEELLASPLTPCEAAPTRDPQMRAQIEEYLSYLSPRAQTVLRLRYGLDEENEHQHSPSETARLLGLTEGVVCVTERDALARLRALLTGKATLGRRNGKICICCPPERCYGFTPEREAALTHAYGTLRAQGTPISARVLAQQAGVGITVAQFFVRTRIQNPSWEERERERQERLVQTYTRLHAQGKPCGSAILAREARVGKPSALAFLKQYRREQDAAAQAW